MQHLLDKNSWSELRFGECWGWLLCMVVWYTSQSAFLPESMSEDHSQWWWLAYLEEKAGLMVADWSRCTDNRLPDLDGEEQRELRLVGHVMVDRPIPNMGRDAGEGLLERRPGRDSDQTVSACCVVDFVVKLVESGVDFFKGFIIAVSVVPRVDEHGVLNSHCRTTMLLGR